MTTKKQINHDLRVAIGGTLKVLSKNLYQVQDTEFLEKTLNDLETLSSETKRLIIEQLEKQLN